MMERLTMPHYGEKGYYMKCSERIGCDGKCGECEELDQIVDRLAYYEDMEEQGRLVVLPCKVGDTVYDTVLGDVREKTVVSIALLTSQSVNCVTVNAVNGRGAITQIENFENWRFGKTVFLSREEAENALCGGGV